MGGSTGLFVGGAARCPEMPRDAKILQDMLNNQSVPGTSIAVTRLAAAWDLQDVSKLLVRTTRGIGK